jgi:hypothetical protein
MNETVTKLPIEQAYAELKKAALQQKCTVLSENPPSQISVKHGSLNGFTAKNAKKIISYNLSSVEDGTKIVSDTRISRDWNNLTLYGSIAAAVLALILLWIANDMQNYLQTSAYGKWTWLAKGFGYPNTQKATMMINLTWVLAAFLIVTIVLEIVVVLYVYRGKEGFAKEIAQSLSS